MINKININLSQLNLVQVDSLNQKELNSEIESFLKDLLSLFSEEQKTIEETSSLFSLFMPLTFLNPQNLLAPKNLMKNFENLKEELTHLYRLIPINEVEAKELSKTLQIGDEINPSLIPLDSMEEKISANSISNLKDISKNMQINKDENQSKQSFLVLDLENQLVSEKTGQKNLIILETLNKEWKISINTNQTNTNPTKEQRIENYISSQLNPVTPDITQSRALEKLSLSITRLSEISDMIFRGYLNSQKTLIVHLEPPEMGRILIKLSMDALGVKAEMRVDSPQVKEMLMNLIPEIRSNLQSSGVKVSDFLLDFNRDYRGYSDSYSGQKRQRKEQKFFEYFA